jgi:extracellular matrix regulatory protein A
MIPWNDRMMICIGHRSFLESSCVEEILTPHGPRAARLKRLAAEVGMLISATEGKRVKSMIKLKTKHIVLSTLEPETLKSKLRKQRSLPASADDYEALNPVEKSIRKKDPGIDAASEKTWKAKLGPFSQAPYDDLERRSGIERRRFSYTVHIPERRSGADRRKWQ